MWISSSPIIATIGTRITGCLPISRGIRSETTGSSSTEVPKYDGDLGRPNVFVPLDREICERKVTYLERAFGSQRDKHWFSAETFMGLMRIRGLECRAPSGFAEAFYGRKTVLGLLSSETETPGADPGPS